MEILTYSTALKCRFRNPYGLKGLGTEILPIAYSVFEMSIQTTFPSLKPICVARLSL